ncbi:hypothetical protein F5883DRAFT_383643, partial [Diaporthe sp. PMI_573]
TFCPSNVSEKVHPGWTVISSHAVLTYWVRDIQYMMALTSDPEYQDIGRESEAGWIDSTRGEVMVGYEGVYIDNKGIFDES